MEDLPDRLLQEMVEYAREHKYGQDISQSGNLDEDTEPENSPEVQTIMGSFDCTKHHFRVFLVPAETLSVIRNEAPEAPSGNEENDWDSDAALYLRDKQSGNNSQYKSAPRIPLSPFLFEPAQRPSAAEPRANTFRGLDPFERDIFEKPAYNSPDDFIDDSSTILPHEQSFDFELESAFGRQPLWLISNGGWESKTHDARDVTITEWRTLICNV